MALADKVNNPPKKRIKCGFREWKESLPVEEQHAIDAMFADKRWTVEAMTTEFLDAGCPVSQSRIRDHRLGICISCNR